MEASKWRCCNVDREGIEANKNRPARLNAFPSSVGSPRERTILLPLPGFPTPRAKAGRWIDESLQDDAVTYSCNYVLVIRLRYRSEDRMPSPDLYEI